MLENHTENHADSGRPTVINRDGKIIIHIPMTFKKRGGRKEIILPPGCRLEEESADGPSINKPLAVGVALGNRWLDLLLEGKVDSTGELAEKVGIDASHVRRILNLAFLSPKLVRAIMAGNEPDGISLQGLRDIPVRWEEQEAAYSK